MDTRRIEINRPQMRGASRFMIPLVILGILLLWLVLKSAVTVNSGQAGVIYRTFGGGVDTEKTLGEGFHIIAPWNKVYMYEARQQELEEKMSVLSSDGLDITIDASAWYQPVHEDLGNLHQTIGERYLERVIQPALQK